jgi:CRP/FNR family transcriptional regulator, cyclic AMP receptor protein
VSRQRINQALHNFERPGIVQHAYNQIDVLDLERLGSFGREQI